MDPTRSRQLKQLTLVFLGAMLVRMLLNRTINGPSIFTDEFQYIEMARSLPQGRGLYWDNIPTLFPCWLYPLLIAPLINLLSWDAAYASIRGLNAVLMALAVVPAYGLARELTGHRRALGAAILVALLPGGGYTPGIMTENLFLPLFTLALWAIYRAVLLPTAWRRLAAGLACGLAFHVKPHAMLLPLVTAATVMIFEADRLRDGAIPGRSRLAQYLAGVGRHWLTALGWVLAMSPRAFVLMNVEHLPVTLGNILGNYTGLAEGSKNYTGEALLFSFLGYLLAWGWCAGLLPAWLLLRKLGPTVTAKEDARTRLMVILTLTATAGMLMLVARHTLVTNPNWVLHERYFFVVLPAVLALFCARAEAGGFSADRRLLLDAAIGALILFYCWVTDNMSWGLPTSAPSFTGTLIFSTSSVLRDVGMAVAVLYVLPAAAALLLLLGNPGGFARQFAIVALLFIAYNIGWYGVHDGALSQWRKEELNLTRKIDRKLEDEDRLLVLKDGLKRNLTWQVGIRNPGMGVALDPELASWWEEALKVKPDGQVVSPYSDNTFLLAANSWKFNLKPEITFDECAVYRVDGETPLRFDSAMLKAYRTDQLTSTALIAGTAYLDGLKLKVLEKKIPADWQPGRISTIELKLRNDSPFTLPGGTMRVAIGYHWSDPRRLGHWAAIIWDDGHRTRLPEWLAPGEEVETSLKVLAPDKPGDAYLLTIKPMLLVGKANRRKSRSQVVNWAKEGGFLEWIKVADATGAEGVAPVSIPAAGDQPTTPTLAQR